GSQKERVHKMHVVTQRSGENAQEEGSKHGQGADDAALPHILEALTAPPAEDHSDEYPPRGSPDWIELTHALAVATDLSPLQQAHEKEHDRQARTAKADAGAEGTAADGERILLPDRGRSGHMSTTRPSESSAAWATASDMVGCA